MPAAACRRGISGSAGLYEGHEGRFVIGVEVGNLDDPLGLVATLAHELGHIHLLGQGRISEDAEDHEPLTDLLTIFFGMGVCTANAAMRENYWENGIVAGWSMGRHSYLGMPVYGYALARFARAREEDGKAWSRELRLDVRSAFKDAIRFLSQELP